MCGMPSMASRSGRTTEPRHRDSLPRVADDFRQTGNDVGELVDPESEVLFVAAPVAERVGVERLADLFGARSLDWPLRLVGAAARFLARQAAMRKGPPEPGFGG